MLEILVTFEEFQLVFNFMLFLTFNTIFFNSGKIKGGKNLGGEGGGLQPDGGKIREVKRKVKRKNQKSNTSYYQR